MSLSNGCGLGFSKKVQYKVSAPEVTQWVRVTQPDNTTLQLVASNLYVEQNVYKGSINTVRAVEIPPPNQKFENSQFENKGLGYGMPFGNAPQLSIAVASQIRGVNGSTGILDLVNPAHTDADHAIHRYLPNVGAFYSLPPTTTRWGGAMITINRLSYSDTSCTVLGFFPKVSDPSTIRVDCVNDFYPAGFAGSFVQLPNCMSYILPIVTGPSEANGGNVVVNFVQFFNHDLSNDSYENVFKLLDGKIVIPSEYYLPSGPVFMPRPMQTLSEDAGPVSVLTSCFFGPNRNRVGSVFDWS